MRSSADIVAAATDPKDRADVADEEVTVAMQSENVDDRVDSAAVGLQDDEVVDACRRNP